MSDPVASGPISVDPMPVDPTRTGRTLLSCFGLGLSPIAPGTFGSIGCAALLWWFGSPLWLAGAFVLVGSLVTLVFGNQVTHEGAHGDPGWVVSDEWAGQALVGLVLPFTGGGGDCLVWLVGFAAFRLFDITKWGPVGTLERIPGPWGVLLDDLAAGVGAAVIAGAVALVRIG